MRKIISLWATPRSTSTAFEWMMRQRGDLSCWHEPFGEVWYQGEDLRWPRATPDGPRTPGLTFAKVWQDLLDDGSARQVFIKDFPHYTKHLWDDQFLDHFHHSFLIRDPAKVLTSMYSHWKDYVLEETAFCEQRELFDRLAEKNGKAPSVIDSDDLLEDPHGITKAYCQAMGIPFMPEALSWEPGERKEVSWYDGGSWHANLRDSDGLKPQTRKYIDIEAAPDHVKLMYDIVRPHYDWLHAHRLVPDHQSIA